MPVYVTQRDVTIYAMRQAYINAAEQKQGFLKTAFRLQIDRGEELPDQGPYLIYLSAQGGLVPVDWKAEVRALLIEKHTKNNVPIRDAVILAEKELEAKEKLKQPNPSVEALGKEYVGGYKLNVRANPNYRRRRRTV